MLEWRLQLHIYTWMSNTFDIIYDTLFKVPKCIEENHHFLNYILLNNDIDNHTGLITSTNTIHDVYRLKLDTQEYIKPKKGFMIIFLITIYNIVSCTIFRV